MRWKPKSAGGSEGFVKVHIKHILWKEKTERETSFTSASEQNYKAHTGKHKVCIAFILLNMRKSTGMLSTESQRKLFCTLLSAAKKVLLCIKTQSITVSPVYPFV